MATWRSTPRGLIAALRARGLIFTVHEPDLSDTLEDIGKPFTGQTWCITGSLEAFKPRARAMEAIRLNGGSVSSVISGATTHLLTGIRGGSKTDMAKQLGIRVVDENTFLNLLNSSQETLA